MSRWMNGGSDRTGRDRSQGLVRGVLDYELDIGIVCDVDPDPIKFNQGPIASEIIATGDPGGHGFPTRAFSLGPESWLSIQGNEFGQSLFIGHERVALPSEWRNPDFPFVRGLPDGNILVSDTTFDISNDKNTWILSRQGEVLSHFGVGSAAVEIAPLEGGLIAVAYHPLSARKFGHRVEPQQRTAIAFFDTQGKLLTSFNHEAGRVGISAENVRCMTRISPVELVFVPEKLTRNGQDIENPIVFYHCATGRTVHFSAPFGGAEAVSVARGHAGESWLLLASPEGFEDQVIAFDPARKMSQYLGAFNGIFRGLSGFVSANIKAGAMKLDEHSPEDSSPQGTSRSAILSGGFLAQEIVSEYNWVFTDSAVLPEREISAFESSRNEVDRPESPKPEIDF